MIKKEKKDLKSKQNNIHILSKDNYIHIPINKDGNCLFRSISVHLTDNRDNYQIIRELIYKYAKENIELSLDFFLIGDIDNVLCSMELNEYIENIGKDGEYVGIIEMVIETKLFSNNIFVYKEENPISNNYILYEKIDTDNNN